MSLEPMSPRRGPIARVLAPRSLPLSPSWPLMPLMAAAVLCLPATAWAGELDVRLVESERGTTIQVRPKDDAPVPEPRKVITSKHGALFFFTDQSGEAQRLKPEARRRLDFAQVGANGSRLVVRLAQRKRASGSLSKFLTHEKVGNGFDIHVRDRLVDPTPAPAPSIPVTAESVDPAARAKTLAALQAKLDADEVNPIVAPLPEPGQPEPIVAVAPEQPLNELEPAEPKPSRLEPSTDEPSDDEPPFALASTDGKTRSMWPYAFLGLMAAVAGVGYWMRRKRPVEVGHAMDVIGRIPLGPRQQVVWIQAGSRQFLVGASEQGVSLLTEFGDQKPAQAATPALPAAREDQQSEAKLAAFKARLNQALGQELRAGGDAADEPEPMPEHLELLLGADPAWATKDAA